jgi:hypothetical protein
LWWHTLVIPALRRWKEEDHEFEASLAKSFFTILKKKKDLFAYKCKILCVKIS